MARRPPIYGNAARTIEQLLGLRPYTLVAVERTASGHFAIRFREQALDGRGRRVLKIPPKKIFGYSQRSPTVRPSDQTHRRRQGERRMGWWLADQVGLNAPVVQRTLFEHDLNAIEELRTAILSLVPPDYVVLAYGWAA